MRYGRWLSMIYGANSTSCDALFDLFRHHSGVLRYKIEKVERPKDFYVPRYTFYGDAPATGI